MGTRRTDLLLAVLGLLMLAGCGSDEKAKEIAALRKGGNLEEARETAIAAVNEDPKRMQRWRELAATNEELFRRMGMGNEERMPLLIEAALICAAVCADNGGDAPGDKWESVCNLVSTDLTSLASHYINGMDKKLDTGRSSGSGRSLDEDAGRSGRSVDGDALSLPGAGRGSSANERSLRIDGDEALDAMWGYSRVKALLQKLPADPGGMAHKQIAALDKTLEGSGETMDVSSDNLSAMASRGEKAVSQGYEMALEDLRDLGYLRPATIFENRIWE